MKRFFGSEPVLIGLLTFAILLLSLLPMFGKLLGMPPGRTFIPVHNSLSDYPFYTSIIRQGLDGQSLVWGRFTSEPQQKGARVHYLYLVMGRIGRLMGAGDAHMVYLASRVVLGGFWIICMYVFISFVVRRPFIRITAFSLALFSAGWPVLSDYQGGRVWWWPMNWWTELDPLQRATFLPHYLTGHILMVFSLILVMRIRKSPGWKPSSALAAVSFLTMFIHPPSMVLPLMIAPIWFAADSKFRTAFWLVPAYAAALGAVLLVRREYTVFPWTMWLDFERMSFALSTREYLLALGPVLPLGIAGFFLNRKNRTVWLLVLWVAVSVFMMEAVKWFPFSSLAVIRELTIGNIRFMQVAVWVPLSVGAGMFLDHIRIRFGVKTAAVVITVIFLITVAGYPQSLRFQREKIYGAEKFTYPSEGFMEAVMSLRTLVSPDGIIWALPLAGQIIPSYTNRTVFTGNQVYYTKNLPWKIDTSWGLYHGNLEPCDAFRIMKEHSIEAVFYGFDEQNAASDPDGAGSALRKLPFLLPWKRFDTTSIFVFTDVAPQGCVTR